VRTTIDLPDDLHRQALSIARDTSRTLSEIVAELMRRGLGQGKPAHTSRSERTGLPVVTLGKVVTTDDVRSLEDDQ
jgi:predicted transcriptional regulator